MHFLQRSLDVEKLSLVFMAFPKLLTLHSIYLKAWKGPGFLFCGANYLSALWNSFFFSQLDHNHILVMLIIWGILFLSSSPILCSICRYTPRCCWPVLTRIILTRVFLSVYAGNIQTHDHIVKGLHLTHFDFDGSVSAGNQLLTFLESYLFYFLPVKTKSIPIVLFMMYFLILQPAILSCRILEII